jgi:hypothetical protein
MTTGTEPVDPAPAADSAPGGLKAKASEVGLKLYLKAPPKAQEAMLTGFTKAQPVAAKAGRYKKQLLVGAGAALVALRLRRRRHRA